MAEYRSLEATKIRVWIGDLDSNWFNPCNWDQQRIPDSSSLVLIPGTTIYQPYIGVDTGYCSTINIEVDNSGHLEIRVC